MFALKILAVVALAGVFLIASLMLPFLVKVYGILALVGGIALFVLLFLGHLRLEVFVRIVVLAGIGAVLFLLAREALYWIAFVPVETRHVLQ